MKYVYDSVIKAQAGSINFHASVHAKERQNSRFICLDDGKAENTAEDQGPVFSHKLNKKESLNAGDKLKADAEQAGKSNAEKIHMKYISGNEVRIQEMQSLTTKTQFCIQS